jgi:hypothetical protein
MKLLHCDKNSFCIEVDSIVVNKNLLIKSKYNDERELNAHVWKKLIEAYRDCLFELHGNDWRKFDKFIGQEENTKIVESIFEKIKD